MKKKKKTSKVFFFFLILLLILILVVVFVSETLLNSCNASDRGGEVAAIENLPAQIRRQQTNFPFLSFLQCPFPSPLLPPPSSLAGTPLLYLFAFSKFKGNHGVFPYDHHYCMVYSSVDLAL